MPTKSKRVQNVKRFLKPKNKKRAVISVHGFLTGGTPDFEPFTKYLLRNNIDEFEVVSFLMYNPSDKETINWKKWVKIADAKTKEYLEKGYEVTIMGYSMGCIIATEVMRLNPEVKNMIMIAPSYYISWLKLPLSQTFLSLKKLKLYIKHRKRLKRAKKAANHIKPLYIMSQIWQSTVHLKKSLNKLYNREIDVMIGTKDTFIKRKKVAQFIKSKKHHTTLLRMHWLKGVDHINILHPPTNRDGWKKIIDSMEEIKGPKL